MQLRVGARSRSAAHRAGVTATIIVDKDSEEGRSKEVRGIR
jgi:hypothetical protein